MNNLAEKFTILEIFEKVIRLKYFIYSNWNLLKDEGSKITIKVYEKALYKIFDDLRLPIKLLESEKITGDERSSINRRLYTVLMLLRGLHSKLKYIHSDWVRPETYTFANRIVNYLPDEYSKSNINIILTDDYTFKENNLINKFNEVFKESRLEIKEEEIEYPTIFLPKIEFTNPLNWAILAHEIGHINKSEIKKIINDVNLIPENTTSKNQEILKKWAEEIICDILSTNILGPAYFASLASFALVTSGIGGNNLHSKSHPSNMLRIRFLYEYITSNDIKLKIGADFTEIKDLTEFFFELLEDIDSPNRELVKDVLSNNFNIPNLTEFLDFLREISKQLNTKIIYKSDNNIAILTDRLKKGIPIGTIRKTDSNSILEKLKYEHISFEQLKEAISEEGTSLWEILGAGWVYKITTIIPKGLETIFPIKTENFQEILQQLIPLYNECDDRLLRSIESSELFKLIEIK